MTKRALVGLLVELVTKRARRGLVTKWALVGPLVELVTV